MYIVTQHEITDPELFWQKASGTLTHPPVGMRLHSTMVVERNKLCQCMWEAESIDVVRDFLEPELGEASVMTYGLVDPDRAIG
ncbi:MULTISPECIES: hypothetical protein [Photobacterium]|uniref:Uncharacterized protein n=1 Tax=Photobacterium ganghwense TaxID=320778 RepID=A0A0J1K0G5_9GAMM|nr:MULTISPECIES: hypothetical protein [Photobacterium]KLV07957.1 hypothetical protein ABT57_13980 [Photobacterium ganghwense]MBV1843184.1 hypothetical protein [Photobacterium ganghwense]PSU07061.1 hypothetical protein C9I92_14990 [Photobacterium ganghwense]QSV15815.1 hypothetical protein FH974_21405 [Photobacterium ganghwense]